MMNTTTKQLTQVTAMEVTMCLPQVATDYLWELVNQRPEAASHTFLLTKQHLNGQELQDILHVAEDGNPNQCHKVYGFPPINAAIRIAPVGNSLVMGLYGPLEALGMMEQ